MGLFGSKIVLKQEYFVSCFNLDKNAIYDFRRKQGFDVSIYTDGGALNVCAEMKGSFYSSLKIINKLNLFGPQECEFYFYEINSFQEVMSFLKKYFTPVPEHVRFTYPDGVFRNYPTASVYLQDGNVLAWKSSSGTSWFTMYIISKDRIIKK